MIGSLSGMALIGGDQIARLLHSEAVSMTHHGEFTGKPETQIYADDDIVLKINTGRIFQSAELAEKWCSLQIARESGYEIYHPDRTWVVLPGDAGCHVANVTPRMLPLHMVDFASLNEHQRVELLAKALACYLDFASRYNQRLDEGLSNFALYGERVLYLDDDIYAWDQFASFTAMLANWLRKSGQLSLELQQWHEIGEALRPMLRAYSSDADDMVCAGLEDQIVGTVEGSKKELIYTLRPQYVGAAGALNKTVFSQHHPIAVLADVHANLPAFEAVLAELNARGVTQYLMLGDVVGYGPNPKACIDLIRDQKIYTLRGNHDHFVAHSGDVRVAMGIMARRIGELTIDLLDEADRDWLGALPVRYLSQQWMAVHGAPVDKSFFNAYVYEMTAERNLEHLKSSDIHYCFHGHSHIQGIYAMDGGRQLPFACPKVANLHDYSAALICPGSVGQPRGGAALAQAAILDPATLEVEMLSVPYDMTRLIADMEENAFPEELIARVREGR